MAATAVDLAGYVAGSWRIDPARSHVSFAIRHLLVSNVHGRFTRVEGEVVTAADPLASHVTATIDLASIDTDNAQRDAHLRSARYLAVETYPRMTYRSTGLRRAGQGFLVHGELSVHGVTRPVVLALKLHQFIRDQHGQLRARLSAVATIDRRVLGISFGVPMDAAGVFIGRRVQVAIEVEASPALDRRSGRGGPTASLRPAGEPVTHRRRGVSRRPQAEHTSQLEQEASMSEPFIFIGTYTIREGKLEDFKQQCQELVEVVEAKEPRLISFHAYVNEDGTEVSVVQVHPDPDSMLFHMQVARDHISEAYQSTLEKARRIDVYGTPSDAVLETVRQLAGSGVPLSVKARHLGGFTRTTAG